MLKRKQIQRLQSNIGGRVLTPDDASFHAIGPVRASGNAEQLHQTAQIIVRPYDGEDVVASLRFAQEVNIDVAVIGGGGHPAKLAAVDDGLLLDMSTQKSIQVNPMDQWAITQTGVTWREFDQVTQAFGLACTGASVPDVGIAGQTLSGGIGWLHRSQGLTCDHVISAELATADGALINVSEEENPELLWALRGAGRHFGVVTSIAYQLPSLSPEVLGGYVTYPLDKLGDLAAHHRALSGDFPETLSTWLIAGRDQTGGGVCHLAIFYAGNPDDGETWHRNLISFSPPIADTVKLTTYLAWQGHSALGPVSAVARCWHAVDLETFPSGTVELVQSSLSDAPTPDCRICVIHLGGVLLQRADELSAVGPVQAENRIIILGDGQAAEEADLCINWADQVRDSLMQLGGQIADPGFSGDSVPVSCLYTDAALERLRSLKASFDPAGLFGTEF